jgi:methylamine dehydrogenase accessory protein MauD
MSNAFTVSYVVLWIAVVSQSLVLLGLVRVVYRLSERETELGAFSSNGNLQGEPAPKFTAQDLSGKLIDSEDFAATQTVLLFISTSCRSCGAALDNMEVLKEKTHGHVIVICSGGPHEECQELAEEHQVDVPVVPDEDHAISKLFRIDVVPTAVLIDDEGKIQAYGNPMRDGELLEEPIVALETEGERV